MVFFIGQEVREVVGAVIANAVDDMSNSIGFKCFSVFCYKITAQIKESLNHKPCKPLLELIRVITSIISEQTALNFEFRISFTLVPFA